MIYTLTCNPSLDYHTPLTRINVGAMNRTKSARIVAGGKGLNVSVVLGSFGVETKTLAVVAGFTGDEWLSLARKEGVDVGVVALKEGQTRINVKIDGVDQTEINAPGPQISGDKMSEYFKLLDMIGSDDTLCICGNGLPGMAPHAYADIIDYVSQKGARIVVDATGDLMRNALSRKPFLIKPNESEMSEIANSSIDSEEDIIECAQRFLNMGVENVLVSLGKKGAILVCGDGAIYRASAPKGRARNTVGSGDSMLAAFLYGYDSGLSMREALALSVAAGSAAAFSENLATKEAAYAILDKVETEIISDKKND